MHSCKEAYKVLQRQIELEQRAWQNRRTPTRSEERLWEALRARRLGVMFRRQVPLCGRYIADFYAPSVRLVVEVDGSAHMGREVADARRDRVLAREGFQVVRVSADLAMRDLTAVLGIIDKAIARR